MIHDPRVISAARYWATRPGNYTLSAVFDEDDARQEAALALLAYEKKRADAAKAGITLPPPASRILYSRILDAVNSFIPGYRQRLMPNKAELADCPVVDCSAERVTLLHERIAILEALPEAERATVTHWILGDTDIEAGAQHGLNQSAWCKRRTKVFNKLAKRGF